MTWHAVRHAHEAKPGYVRETFPGFKERFASRRGRMAGGTTASGAESPCAAVWGLRS